MILVFGIKIGDKYVKMIDYPEDKRDYHPGHLGANYVTADYSKMVIEMTDEFYGWTARSIGNMVKQLSDAMNEKVLDLQEIKLIPKYE